MSDWTPKDLDFEARLRASFARQTMMATIGARLVRVAPGAVDIALEPAPHILQQHGFVHGGVVATIADSAAGYAALSLFPRGTGILTTEFKINFLAPAAGERLIAKGRVVRAGRTVTVAMTDVEAWSDGVPKLCALLTGTLLMLEGRAGVTD